MRLLIYDIALTFVEVDVCASSSWHCCIRIGSRKKKRKIVSHLVFHEEHKRDATTEVAIFSERLEARRGDEESKSKFENPKSSFSSIWTKETFIIEKGTLRKSADKDKDKDKYTILCIIRAECFSGVNDFWEWIFSRFNILQGWILFRSEYFSDVNIFGGEYFFKGWIFFKGVNICEGWIFFIVNIFQGWILLRSKYLLGVNIFYGWIFFRGEYLLGANVFRGDYFVRGEYFLGVKIFQVFS